MLSFVPEINSIYLSYYINRTKYSFYRAMINIISYGKTWSIIPKFTPMIQ